METIDFVVLLVLIVIAGLYFLIKRLKKMGLYEDNKDKIITISVIIILLTLFIPAFFRVNSSDNKPILHNSDSIPSPPSMVERSQKIDDSIHAEKPETEINKDSIIKVMRKYFTFKKDEFKDDDFMWVFPKNRPYYPDENRLYCYFCMIDGVAQNFRMKLHYTADDWLFIKNWTIKIDNRFKFDVAPEEDGVRDNYGGKIWEIYDVSMTAFDQSMLDAIAVSKSAKIKMNGSDYYDTRKLTSSEFKYLQLSYKYYRKLGGHLE